MFKETVKALVPSMVSINQIRTESRKTTYGLRRTGASGLCEFLNNSDTTSAILSEKSLVEILSGSFTFCTRVPQSNISALNVSIILGKWIRDPLSIKDKRLFLTYYR